MGRLYAKLDWKALRENPHPELNRLLEAGPLVKAKLPIIGETWTLTSYAAVDEFLRDSDSFVRDPKLAGKKYIAGMQWWMPGVFRSFAQNMMGYDGDDHRRLRLLVEKAFVRRNVDGMRDRIVTLTDELIDSLEADVGSDGQVDFMDKFGRELPLTVICELLGLPESDRPKFRKWFAPIGRVSSGWDMFRIVPGMMRLRAYTREQIEICRRQPREGLISELVAAEESGDRLSDNELLAMIFLLLVAGHETTTHLLCGGLLTLLDHPDQLELLLNDWSLSESAVAEIMRYGTPIQMSKPRYAARDMELHGQSIERGELIIALLASANLDPTEFPDPETFDIRRSPNRHVGFGKGIHTCLGLRLAHLETEVAYERLFARHPNVQLAVDRDEVKWRSRIGMRTLESLPIKLS